MDVVNPPRRFDVVLVGLDPTIGSEMQKTRPCLVVSPDEMNRHLRTVIIAPMTSVVHDYPSRVRVRFQGKDGEVALDQLRVVDRARIVRRLGSVSDATAAMVATTLVEMFEIGDA